jgi:hypothetical protein
MARKSNSRTRKAGTATPRARTERIVEPKGIVSPSQQQIAERAYKIWLAKGCPAGEDVVHWHEAEAQLMLGL